MELHVIEREGRETVVLLDNDMRIVKPVYDYLKFQRQKDKALNTLKASGWSYVKKKYKLNMPFFRLAYPAKASAFSSNAA